MTDLLRNPCGIVKINCWLTGGRRRSEGKLVTVVRPRVFARVIAVIDETLYEQLRPPAGPGGTPTPSPSATPNGFAAPSWPSANTSKPSTRSPRCHSAGNTTPRCSPN